MVHLARLPGQNEIHPSCAPLLDETKKPRPDQRRVHGNTASARLGFQLTPELLGQVNEINTALALEVADAQL